jgi:single-strand DNA-binding protein
VVEQEIGELVNEVRIRGRVSGAPRHKQLPSGDEVVSIRVVVPRPEGARVGGSGKSVSVDTFECVAWSRRPQSVMTRLSGDEHVFVTGALRRRFWRAGGAVASMVEIEVVQLKRIPAPRTKAAVTGLRRREASDA